MKNGRHCPLTYSPYNPTIHPFKQQHILTLTYREKNRKRKVSKMKVSIQFPVYSSLFLLLCFCLFVFLFCFFQDRVSLCSPGYRRTHFVDLAGLDFRNLPASASQVLRLKVCATTARLHLSF